MCQIDLDVVRHLGVETPVVIIIFIIMHMLAKLRKNVKVYLKFEFTFLLFLKIISS